MSGTRSRSSARDIVHGLSKFHIGRPEGESMQTPLRRTLNMTWLLLCAIMPLASALDFPPAMPSFRANVWTTYASSGVDCDAGGCQSHKYHQMLTNHTLEQSLRVSFDAKSERFVEEMSRQSGNFDLPSCCFAVQPGKESTGRVVMYKEVTGV